MNIAVLGMWHLGTVTAGCLADKGYNVFGYDQNADMVAMLLNGNLPVNEPGLSELIETGIKSGLLSFTSDPATITECDIIWAAYDTPVDEQDGAAVYFVLNSLEALFPYLKDGQLIIISSQLPVGTTSQIETQLREKRPGISVSFAYVPENLRLGNAIDVFKHPDRIVVGVRAERDKTLIARLLHPFSDNIIWMSVESAEMTKHAINAFLATSVAFINELSGICEYYGADASEVEKGIKSDHRIGRHAYLRPGPAFAGGTLARDLKYIIRFGHEKKLLTPLFSGVAESNELHKKWSRRKLKEALKTFKGKRVAVLGLTYKPGTDTLRRSEAVETAKWLSDRGTEVVAYDPAIKTLPGSLENIINLGDSPREILKGAHAVLLETPWPEFNKLKVGDFAFLMDPRAVIDSGGFLSDNLKNQPGIIYVTIGGM